MNIQKLNIVVPIYNEADNIPTFASRIYHVIQYLPFDTKVFFIDDGSNDDSIRIIESLDHSVFKLIALSRNFGHQNALKSGIDLTDGDVCICMDGDLQHPPELIPEMIKLWQKGFDVVYTIRRPSSELSNFKKITSNFFYKLLNLLSDIDLEQGTADFRLMDKKVVAELKRLDEADLFFRGLIKWVGFQQIGIEYEPQNRHAGKSKYTFKKMMQLALKGITSFSIKPLYFATYLGIIFSLCSLLYIPYIIYSYVYGKVVSGWSSLLATVTFFGGLQLMILGIIGIYLGKVFMQSKKRPHYIIKKTIF